MYFNQYVETDRQDNSIEEFANLSGILKAGKNISKTVGKTAFKASTSTGKAIIKNPKTTLKVTAGAAGATYLAAKSGVFGEKGEKIASNVTEKVGNVAEDVLDETIDTVGTVGSKILDKVVDKIGNPLANMGDAFTNNLIGLDIDTTVVLIIIFIIIILIGLKYGIPVGLCVFGGFYYNKQQKKNQVSPI